MRRHIIRHLLVITVLAILVGAGVLTLRFNALADDNTAVPLNQAVSPLLQHAQVAQAASGSQPLNVSVGLQVQDPAALDSLLQSLYDPQSSQYGRYLSTDQFKQQFAPVDAQVQQVTSFLQSNGCNVTGIASDNLLVDAACNVAQAQQAFGARINLYKNGKQTFYANSSPLKVPKKLKKLIASINGLDSSQRFHRLYSQQHHATGVIPTGYGPAALSSAYNFTPLQNAGILGDNQSVAFLELDGFQQSDINTYYQTYGLNSLQNAAGNTLSTPNITTIKVKKATGTPGASAIEPTLDLEVLLGLAPHANALVYEGADSYTPSFNDVLSQIVNDNKAQVVSISWAAECESNASLGSEWQTVDNLLKQGAAQGMSFFAASGDSGAYACASTDLQVGVPASDPYVTSVGGTTLSLNSDNTYKSETGWSDILDNTHGEMGSGSGGGISSYWSIPAWQRGSGVISGYSSGKPCNAGASKYCRQVPDVSASADEGDSNPLVADAGYCSVCTLSGWQQVGGTSAAAPTWAAAALLINQYLQSQGKPSMGLANPALYNLFNSQTPYPPFHDITTGSTNPTSAFVGTSILNPKVDKSKLANYQAGTGYDMVTGMGSPNVYNIARDLAAASGNLIANDSFQRANQQLWGTASDNNTWVGDANSSSIGRAFSITNNMGVVTGNSGTYSAVLGNTSTNAEVLVSTEVNNFVSGTSIGSVLRWTDSTHWYRAAIDGTNLVIQKASSTTALATTKFSATANTGYLIRFRIVGTTLSAKVWPAGQIEPASWMITATDTSYTGGNSGIRVQVANSITVKYTVFQATSIQ